MGLGKSPFRTGDRFKTARERLDALREAREADSLGAMKRVRERVASMEGFRGRDEALKAIDGRIGGRYREMELQRLTGGDDDAV